MRVSSTASATALVLFLLPSLAAAQQVGFDRKKVTLHQEYDGSRYSDWETDYECIADEKIITSVELITYFEGFKVRYTLENAGDEPILYRQKLSNIYNTPYYRIGLPGSRPDMERNLPHGNQIRVRGKRVATRKKPIVLPPNSTTVIEKEGTARPNQYDRVIKDYLHTVYEDGVTLMSWHNDSYFDGSYYNCRNTRYGEFPIQFTYGRSIAEAKEIQRLDTFLKPYELGQLLGPGVLFLSWDMEFKAVYEWIVHWFIDDDQGKGGTGV